jgi:hypothetical protein
LVPLPTKVVPLPIIGQLLTFPCALRNVDYYFGPVTTWARNNGVYVRISDLRLGRDNKLTSTHFDSKIFLGEFGINDSDPCLALLNRLMTFLTVSSPLALPIGFWF